MPPTNPRTHQINSPPGFDERTSMAERITDGVHGQLLQRSLPRGQASEWGGAPQLTLVMGNTGLERRCGPVLSCGSSAPATCPHMNGTKKDQLLLAGDGFIFSRTDRK